MIKTILNTILFLHLVILVQAQSSFRTSSSFATQQGKVDHEVAPSISLRNTSSQTIQLKWSIKKTNLSSGWQAVVCDHQCYTSLTQNHTFSLKPNEVLHDFKVSFRPNGKEGIGNLEIEIYDVKNPATKQTITFTGAAQSAITSTTKVTKQTTAPKIYPNPAIEYISIKDDYNKVKVLEIYNVVGRKMKTIMVNHAGEQYDVSRLPRGMYMVRMLDSNGTIVRTQRISKYNP